MAAVDSNSNYFDAGTEVTAEEVKQEALYLHEVWNRHGRGEEYAQARSDFQEIAVEYLEDQGLDSQAASKHASDVKNEIAIGDYIEAVDKIAAWESLLERGEN